MILIHEINGLDIERSDEPYCIVSIDYITRIDLMSNNSALILIEDVGHLPSFSSPDLMAVFLFIEWIWVMHYGEVVIGCHTSIIFGYQLNYRHPHGEIKYPETYCRESEGYLQTIEDAAYYCLISARCKRTT